MRNRIILFSLAAIGFLTLSGCLKFEEFNPSNNLGGAPTVTLTVDNILENSFDIVLSSSAPGAVSYVVVAGIDTVYPDGQDVLLGSAGGFTKASALVETAAEEQVFTIDGLSGNLDFTVYAVSANSDGIWGEVERAYVHTDDKTPPEFVSSSPASSLSTRVATDFEIKLTFSEIVTVNPAKKFTFYYYFDDQEVVVDAADISVVANVVTIKQSYQAAKSELVFLSYEEGAVLDQVGLPVDTLLSGFDGEGDPVNLYWRMEKEFFAVDETKFLPEIQSAVTELDTIFILFDRDIKLATSAATGMVKINYNGDGFITTIDVPKASLIPMGDTLAIKLPQTADYGQTVSFSIAEGVVVDTYGNANEAYESSNTEGAWWLLSYGRDINVIVGTYNVQATSYFGVADDESFTMTIELDAENANQVLISGFWGTTTKVPAVFDGDFASLTLPLDYLLEETADYELWLLYPSNWGGGVMSGFVAADGSISLPFGGYYDDLTVADADGWYNIFTAAAWTKTAKSSNYTITKIDSEKPRFKL